MAKPVTANVDHWICLRKLMEPPGSQTGFTDKLVHPQTGSTTKLTTTRNFTRQGGSGQLPKCRMTASRAGTLAFRVIPFGGGTRGRLHCGNESTIQLGDQGRQVIDDLLPTSGVSNGILAASEGAARDRKR